MAKEIQRQEQGNQIVQRPVQQVTTTRVQKASYLGAVNAVMVAIKINADPDTPQEVKNAAASQAVRIVENSDVKEVLERITLEHPELQA